MPETADFPTWFRAGCYGGLACSLLAAAGIAAYAMARRRGTPRQLAGAMLGCLAAAACLLPAIIWSQTRLDLQGPALSVSEVLLWLSWVSVLGWMLPLGSSMGFLLFAVPFDARQARKARARPLETASTENQPHERDYEPLGKGVAWGRLIHLDGPYLHREVPLTRQVVSLGRERDNDILLDADLASRYHAELRWERGRGYLKDHGSMNGTSVNGQNVWGLVPLHDGDLLEIGGRRFRYQDRHQEAKKAEAAPTSEATQESAAETAPLPAMSLAAQSSQRASGWLLVSGGPGAGSRYELTQAVVTLGRAAACDLVIQDSSISRRHAQILRQEDGFFYAQDLGSQNGTALNGQRLTAPRRLAEGDTLTLGTIPLRFVSSPIPTEREQAQAEDSLLPPQLPAEPATAAAPASGEAASPARKSRVLSTPVRGREGPNPLRLPSRALQPEEVSGAASDVPSASEEAVVAEPQPPRHHPHRLIPHSS
ncbi:MAG TPA: FHA domain-containing protein [Ktedonobacterales bacterium]|jgi:pSer/pThr/pTyr-binding forkhead associated (FHA) protein